MVVTVPSALVSIRVVEPSGLVVVSVFVPEGERSELLPPEEEPPPEDGFRIVSVPVLFLVIS